MKAKLFFFPVIAAFLFSECQKDIVIKPLPYQEQLTIECLLQPGKVPQLFLSKSLPYFSSSSSPQDLFARGASVTITANSNTDILVADSSYDKFRCRWTPYYRGNFPAAFGQTYSLSVVYNGKTYTATTTIDQTTCHIQNVSYVQHFHDLYGDHEGVVVEFSDPAGAGNNYRYQMDRYIDSSVYGTSNLGVIHSTCTDGTPFGVSEIGRSVYFDKNVDGQNITITVEPAYDHQQDDSTFVMIQCLDKNSAEFYDQLDQQMQAQLNPFVEPVTLHSKIDGCIGVFGSCVLSDSVLFVYPE